MLYSAQEEEDSIGCGRFNQTRSSESGCYDWGKVGLHAHDVSLVICDRRMLTYVAHPSHSSVSMFLQNMMVVSANTTLASILGTTKRRRTMNDDNEQVDLLPTLLTAIQTHSDNADLAFSVFGLLSNIAIHDEGSASLSGGLDVHTLATEALRIHSSHSDLHNVVSSLLQNVEYEVTTG